MFDREKNLFDAYAAKRISRRDLLDGAAKLGTLADEAANTTLKEAAEGVSKDLEGLNATNANNAVDAAQKVATDSVKWVEQLAGACG